jgi:signal peptidase II
VRTLEDLGVDVQLSLPVQLGLMVAAIGVVLDQATKELAEAWLVTSEYVPWLGEHIGWQLVYNPGGAFGLPAPPWIFLIVTLLVVGIVARTLPATKGLLPATAYGLLLSGALGNMVDRLLRGGDEGFLGGHVVDFVAWGQWPRFNVADSAISIGFVLLVVSLCREKPRDREHDEPAAGDAAGALDDEQVR